MDALMSLPSFSFSDQPSSTPPPVQQFNRRDGKYYSEAKIMVWWDTETAPLPPSADPRDLIENIEKALDEGDYHGKKIVFWGRSRYRELSEDFHAKIQIGILKGYPRVKEPSRIACSYPGKQDGKGAISRFILLDMFKAARLAKCPVNHMLISGNKLLLRPLSVLKHWGHNILIARPSTASNVFDDCKIATTVWDWQDVAEGRDRLCPIIQTLNTIQEATSINNGANETSDLSPENTHPTQLTQFILGLASPTAAFVSTDQDKLHHIHPFHK